MSHFDVLSNFFNDFSELDLKIAIQFINQSLSLDSDFGSKIGRTLFLCKKDLNSDDLLTAKKALKCVFFFSCFIQQCNNVSPEKVKAFVLPIFPGLISSLSKASLRFFSSSSTFQFKKSHLRYCFSSPYSSISQEMISMTLQESIEISFYILVNCCGVLKLGDSDPQKKMILTQLIPHMLSILQFDTDFRFDGIRFMMKSGAEMYCDPILSTIAELDDFKLFHVPTIPQKSSLMDKKDSKSNDNLLKSLICVSCGDELSVFLSKYPQRIRSGYFFSIADLCIDIINTMGIILGPHGQGFSEISLASTRESSKTEARSICSPDISQDRFDDNHEEKTIHVSKIFPADLFSILISWIYSLWVKQIPKLKSQSIRPYLNVSPIRALHQALFLISKGSGIDMSLCESDSSGITVELEGQSTTYSCDVFLPSLSLSDDSDKSESQSIEFSGHNYGIISTRYPSSISHLQEGLNILNRIEMIGCFDPDITITAIREALRCCLYYILKVYTSKELFNEIIRTKFLPIMENKDKKTSESSTIYSDKSSSVEKRVFPFSPLHISSPDDLQRSTVSISSFFMVLISNIMGSDGLTESVSQLLNALYSQADESPQEILVMLKYFSSHQERLIFLIVLLQCIPSVVIDINIEQVIEELEIPSFADYSLKSGPYCLGADLFSLVLLFCSIYMHKMIWYIRQRKGSQPKIETTQSFSFATFHMFSSGIHIRMRQLLSSVQNILFLAHSTLNMDIHGEFHQYMLLLCRTVLMMHYCCSTVSQSMSVSSYILSDKCQKIFSFSSPKPPSKVALHRSLKVYFDQSIQNIVRIVLRSVRMNITSNRKSKIIHSSTSDEDVINDGSPFSQSSRKVLISPIHYYSFLSHSASYLRSSISLTSLSCLADLLHYVKMFIDSSLTMEAKKMGFTMLLGIALCICTVPNPPKELQSLDPELSMKKKRKAGTGRKSKKEEKKGKESSSDKRSNDISSAIPLSCSPAFKLHSALSLTLVRNSPLPYTQNIPSLLHQRKENSIPSQLVLHTPMTDSLPKDQLRAQYAQVLHKRRSLISTIFSTTYEHVSISLSSMSIPFLRLLLSIMHLSLASLFIDGYNIQEHEDIDTYTRNGQDTALPQLYGMFNSVAQSVSAIGFQKWDLKRMQMIMDFMTYSVLPMFPSFSATSFSHILLPMCEIVCVKGIQGSMVEFKENKAGQQIAGKKRSLKLIDKIDMKQGVTSLKGILALLEGSFSSSPSLQVEREEEALMVSKNNSSHSLHYHSNASGLLGSILSFLASFSHFSMAIGSGNEDDSSFSLGSDESIYSTFSGLPTHPRRVALLLRAMGNFSVDSAIVHRASHMHAQIITNEKEKKLMDGIGDSRSHDQPSHSIGSESGTSVLDASISHQLKTFKKLKGVFQPIPEPPSVLEDVIVSSQIFDAIKEVLSSEHQERIEKIKDSLYVANDPSCTSEISQSLETQSSSSKPFQSLHKKTPMIEVISSSDFFHGDSDEVLRRAGIEFTSDRKLEEEELQRSVEKSKTEIQSTSDPESSSISTVIRSETGVITPHSSKKISEHALGQIMKIIPMSEASSSAASPLSLLHGSSSCNLSSVSLDIQRARVKRFIRDTIREIGGESGLSISENDVFGFDEKISLKLRQKKLVLFSLFSQGNSFFKSKQE
ncbi:hypothetical protein ADUPG1_013618 [Aduncisulcus paluster]|uniref:Uncharacterized protein n=1 Tax=Aduncisulcus paluster TaxID=2918883 RepID=A0ABQ5K3J3_9EUKA|nr:hypothetical protein ADUPG1_013618 [Aduncisulcus paluster]